jgi:hypothetical protein
LPIADGRETEDGKQAVVKLLKLFIDGFGRPTDEVRGNPFFSALELTLVEEMQARGQKRDD